MKLEKRTYKDCTIYITELHKDKFVVDYDTKSGDTVVLGDDYENLLDAKDAAYRSIDEYLQRTR